MNKEQIDEIAMRVASEVNLFGRIAPDNAIKAFTHALLAELANVSEPVVSEDELKDMASGEFESAMSFGLSRDNFMRLARSVAQRATPLPQPDLVAENEALKALNVELTAKCNWYNADGARLERERDYHLDSAKHVYVECTELRQQLSAMTESRNQWICDHMAQVIRTNEEIHIAKTYKFSYPQRKLITNSW